MSIKLYTVKCSVHGVMEVNTNNNSTNPCPMNCTVPIGYKLGETVLCNQPLQRIYDPPNVHYKGSGWASKDD